MEKAVFFDLDGTLLDLDLDVFVQEYFRALLKLAAARGLDAEAFLNGLNASIAVMMGNDGSRTNEELFWSTMQYYIPDILDHTAVFEDFYLNDFNEIGKLTTQNKELVDLVESLKGKARLILATNPYFPQIATHTRLRWAGFEPEDFEKITTFETARASKPSVSYYRNLLDELDLKPEQVIMVGNDAVEDGAAAELGIPVFLLEKNLLNAQRADQFQKGDVQDLRRVLEEFLEEKNEY